MFLLKSMENIALDMRGRQNGICLFANFLVFVFNREGLHCSREILLRAPAVLRRLGAGASVPPAPPSLCLQPPRELLDHILKILAQFVSFSSQPGKQRHREVREWTTVSALFQPRSLLFSVQFRGRTGRKSKTRSLRLRNWVHCGIKSSACK